MMGMKTVMREDKEKGLTWISEVGSRKITLVFENEEGRWEWDFRANGDYFYYLKEDGEVVPLKRTCGCWGYPGTPTNQRLQFDGNTSYSEVFGPGVELLRGIHMGWSNYQYMNPITGDPVMISSHRKDNKEFFLPLDDDYFVTIKF